MSKELTNVKKLKQLLFDIELLQQLVDGLPDHTHLPWVGRAEAILNKKKLLDNIIEKTEAAQLIAKDL